MKITMEYKELVSDGRRPRKLGPLILDAIKLESEGKTSVVMEDAGKFMAWKEIVKTHPIEDVRNLENVLVKVLHRSPVEDGFREVLDQYFYECNNGGAL